MKTKREARRRDKRETARTGIPKDEEDSDIAPICFFSRSDLQKKERRRRQKGGQEVVRLLIYKFYLPTKYSGSPFILPAAVRLMVWFPYEAIYPHPSTPRADHQMTTDAPWVGSG